MTIFSKGKSTIPMLYQIITSTNFNWFAIFPFKLAEICCGYFMF